GAAVTISADGAEALIGAPADEGTVFAFKRSGAKWSEEDELTPNDELGPGAEFGASLAISESGTTALIGGPNDGVAKAGAQIAGAAWVYTHSGSTWTQGAKLTGSAESGAGRFGASLSLSADGDTALIGSPSEASGTGSARVFTRSGEAW